MASFRRVSVLGSHGHMVRVYMAMWPQAFASAIMRNPNALRATHVQVTASHVHANSHICSPARVLHATWRRRCTHTQAWTEGRERERACAEQGRKMQQRFHRNFAAAFLFFFLFSLRYLATFLLLLLLRTLLFILCGLAFCKHSALFSFLRFLCLAAFCCPHT